MYEKRTFASYCDQTTLILTHRTHIKSVTLILRFSNDWPFAVFLIFRWGHTEKIRRIVIVEAITAIKAITCRYASHAFGPGQSREGRVCPLDE